MPPSPLAVAWSKLVDAWSFLKQRRFSTGYIRLWEAAALVVSQTLWLGFRSITSVLVWSAAVLLGAILARFCVEGGDEVAAFLENFFSKDILAAKEIVKGFGGISLFSFTFLAWKRRTAFLLALKATWAWIWQGGFNATKGWVRALTTQLPVYAGLLFAFFTLVRGEPIGKREPTPAVTSAELREYQKQLITIWETQSASLMTEIQTVIDSRNCLIVSLDKSAVPDNEQREKFDLVYVALFDNASFKKGSEHGRKLNPSEEKRLRDFAKALRQIAETKSDWGNKTDRLTAKVRGFASDAPKTKKPTEKDEENNKIANERAQSVRKILGDELENVPKDSVFLPDPTLWEESGAQMRSERQYNDGPIQRPSFQETATAEAPNRRVEVLVTLPPRLRVSNSIPASRIPQL